MSIIDSLITDRTQADVDAGNEKGTYNAADMRRVASAVNYVALRLLNYGVSVNLSSKTDWSDSDTPTASQLEDYLGIIADLRAALIPMITTPSVPPSMEGFTYKEANDLEQILKDTNTLVVNMLISWFYSNDLFAGEV